MKTKNLKGWIMLCAGALMIGCNTAAPVDIEQQVDELYAKMPQEERIAQLKSMYMDELFNEKGQLDTAKCKELIPYGIGHFSQFCMQQPREANELRDRAIAIQNWLMNNTPNGIPALLHEEVLSGVNTLGSTIYPQQIGQAGSFNPELAELKTIQTSTTLRKMGGIFALSPMVDVCRTPSFNRLEESYGEDGYLSAVMGTAFVKGLQQGDLKKGVGACSKHYLGYGGGGDADEKELMEEILLPHETMIRMTGSVAVMPGYHAMKNSPNPAKGEANVNCVANSWILTDILRDYLGFDGMVVSDYTAIDQIPLKSKKEKEKSEQIDTTEVVLKAAIAINAGNDVDFPFGANYQYLQKAIDKGLVKPEVLERAVKNVLRIKFRMGLFDKNPYLYSKEKITLDTPEERQTAYDIASQSIVLLQNNGILPIKKIKAHDNSLNVLLTGPNANSIWAMCGDYTYPAMSYFWKKVEDVADRDNPHIVKLLEAMTTKKPKDVKLMYSRGCDWTETIETKFGEVGDERAWEFELLHRKVDSGEKADKAEALKMAQEAEVIIAAMGENVMLCGENRDREGLRLPGQQEQFVEELLQTGKPVILVLFGGRAQVISGIAEKCAAIIQAWYPGEEGGNALADILYGNISPSAKLSVSYPNEELNEPICYNHGIVKDPRVAWPFGHGLTYTKFEYKNLQLENDVQTNDDYVELTFQVRNTGTVKADEIAQIYLSPTTGDQHIRPIQLQGFARISLEPGQGKTITTRLFLDQFGYYSRKDKVREWTIDPGVFTVRVGASSQDIKLEKRLEITGKTITKPLRDHYFSETIISQ